MIVKRTQGKSGFGYEIYYPGIRTKWNSRLAAKTSSNCFPNQKLRERAIEEELKRARFLETAFDTI